MQSHLCVCIEFALVGYGSFAAKHIMCQISGCNMYRALIFCGGGGGVKGGNGNPYVHVYATC